MAAEASRAARIGPGVEALAREGTLAGRWVLDSAGFPRGVRCQAFLGSSHCPSAWTAGWASVAGAGLTARPATGGTPATASGWDGYSVCCFKWRRSSIYCE